MIKKVLKVLFQRLNSEQLIRDCLSWRQRSFEELVDGDSFIHFFEHDYPDYSIDQIKTIEALLSDDWMREIKESVDYKYSERKSLYNVVLRFAESVLELVDEEPKCRYDQVLDWHELSMDLGEDLFSIALVASHDAKVVRNRCSFQWPPYLNPHHPQLEELFNEPLTDLHAHLKGTSLNFDLNWLCLMNHIQNRASDFKTFGIRQHAQLTVSMSDYVTDLYHQVMKAAVIRLYLFAMIKGRGKDVCDCLKEMLLSQSRLEAVFYSSNLQNQIDCYRQLFGRKYFREDSGYDIVDYAINDKSCYEHKDDLLETVLSGERELLYSMLKCCYEGRLSRMDEHLLTVYLIIKIRFRHEMVQLNKGVGFDNFSTYEERKTAFIKDNSVYHKLIAQLAIGSFLKKNPEKRYMEARIVPEEKGNAILRQIEKTDRDIHNHQFCDAKNWNYYYIYHFIKSEDKTSFPLMELVPRHHALRERVRNQAKAIYAFRNYNLLENTQRVVGIDAANSEIKTRPEVFAQAYRYLRQHAVREDILVKPCALCMTYHVGEDFMDVADGLRAYDEVIRFLRFSDGDRLGHALVLGVDVESYYKRRQNVIAMPLQMILDNTVWLRKECESIGDPYSLLPILDKDYLFYFREVFGKRVPSYPIDSYYLSWLLRGDNPFCYQIPSVEPEMHGCIDEWEQNNLIMDDSEIVNARLNKEARSLCRLYHFDRTVKEKGARVVEYLVSEQYVKTIEHIREKKLQDAENRHLAIECNPTSNFRIGELRDYADHPITVFYNTDSGCGKKSHNISVSINTDDAGVFATSIEREYAVMAKALDNKKSIMGENSDESLFNWLHDIRRFGQEQRFVKNHAE